MTGLARIRDATRRRGHGFALSVALALMAGPAVAAAPAPGQAPGARFEVRPANLPPPYATPSVRNSSDGVARPADPPLRVPDGFSVGLFADGLSDPRAMAVAPNGDLLVAESGAGRLRLLRDADGDGRAEIRAVFAEGFDYPFGMAFRDGWLYVADTDRVWRLAWRPGERAAAGPPEPVTADGALGSGRGHRTRNLVFSPDGARLFVAIGSAGNIAVEPAPRATIQSFAADGSDQRIFAAGLRNPVGMAFYPGTDDLYAVVNERDGMGDGLVPDYLTRVEEGGFYGWPYAYIGTHPQPEFAERRPDLVAASLTPDLLFRSHSAPLGLVFYEGEAFPPAYRGDAFVALHGSWNAAEPRGYMVVRVPFENGRPVGHYETFLSGFWIDGAGTAQVWGRPVGLATAADGSLLVADDGSGAIWRVSYRGGGG